MYSTMLTARQREVLEFIRLFIRTNSRSPSVRDIQRHFGFASPNGAQAHITALRDAGHLRGDIEGARAIVPSQLETGLRVYGTIPAGTPIDATEDSDEILVGISPELFGGRAGERVFALRVRGTSMLRAGILDGDIAVLAARPAREGDVVAALVDGRSTLKRYRVIRGKVILRPEGPGYRDIKPTTELLVQGVMIGLIRRQR